MSGRDELPHSLILDKRQSADDDEAAWLRERGWKHTCQTPGSYWMWQRAWDEKVFLVDQSTAARIQASWDLTEDQRAHPGEYGEC